MAGPEDAKQAALDEIHPEQAPTLPTDTTGVSFDGHSLEELSQQSRSRYGLVPGGTLYRHTYLYSVDYPIGRQGDESSTGKIELKARTWNWQQDPGDPLKSSLRGIARKAGSMFNTAVETSDYAGYLSGFFEAGYSPIVDDHFEDGEMPEDSGAEPGRVDWHVTLHDDSGEITGVAQGFAYPWNVTTEYIDGAPAQHVAPHKWTLSYQSKEDRYELKAPGDTRARRRYQPGGAGNGKTVYINGKEVGKAGAEGRTFLKNEYSAGDGHTWGDRYSRKGLIAETEATAQALRKGGTLYMTGETQTAIHLSTSRALPPEFQAADADSVSPNQPVTPGRDGSEIHVLSMDQPTDGTLLKCVRDEKVTRHMGYSIPEYRHTISRRWSP